MNGSPSSQETTCAGVVRIASRRGPQKANVAIQHSMLIAIWHMGTTGALYDDPGADYFTRLPPTEPRTAPSTNSKPWATASPSTTPPDPQISDTKGNLRVRGGVVVGDAE